MEQIPNILRHIPETLSQVGRIECELHDMGLVNREASKLVWTHLPYIEYASLGAYAEKPRYIAVIEYTR